MASLELAEEIAQLLKDVPDKEREALLAACRKENQEEEQTEIAPPSEEQGIRVTETTEPVTTVQPSSERPVDNGTEEDEPIASLIRKRKASVQDEEGSQKKRVSVTVEISGSESQSEGQNPNTGEQKKKAGNFTTSTTTQVPFGTPASRTRSASSSPFRIGIGQRKKATARKNTMTPAQLSAKNAEVRAHKEKEAKIQANKKARETQTERGEASASKKRINPVTHVARAMTGRKVIPDLLIDDSVLDILPGKLLELVNEGQGWGSLFKTGVVVDEELVREFYSKFRVVVSSKGMEASVAVKGAEWTFTDEDVAKILGVSSEGSGEYPKGEWPGDKSVVLEALYGNKRKAVANLMNVGMSPLIKGLHQIAVRGLVPRMEKTSNVHIQDAYLIYDMLLKKKINLSVLMMKHMQICAASTNHGLPYPRIVKMLITNAGVYVPKKEVTLVHRFDAASLSKMNWGMSSEGIDLTEIHQRMDTLQECMDQGFAKMEKLFAVLSAKVGAVSRKVITDARSEKTGPDEDEVDESE